MAVKRFFDFCLVLLGIIMLLPFFIVISIWVKLSSAGPIFYRQVRAGRFGRPFKIYKFRTMVIDADRKGNLLTVASDSRITGCGRLLRRYKLDELPQLFNVLKAEMSFVGPRPEVPKYVEKYIYRLGC